MTAQKDKEHKINHSGDTRFNVENPPNAEGKKPQTPASKHSSLL
jgi:hypothetical protein